MEIEQKRSEDVFVILIVIASIVIALTVMVCLAIVKFKKHIRRSKTSFDAEANSGVV